MERGMHIGACVAIWHTCLMSSPVPCDDYNSPNCTTFIHCIATCSKDF